MARFGAGMTGLAFACAAFCALPAAAQVRSDVTVSNLRYVLTDLTPGDGQTPSFTFDDAVPTPISLSAFVTPQVGNEQNAYQYVSERGYFSFSPHTQLSLALDVHIAMQAAEVAGVEQTGSAWVGFLGNAEWGPPKDRWARRDSEEAYGDVGAVFGNYVPRYDRDETLWLTFVNDSDYAADGEFAIQLEARAFAQAAPVPEAPAPLMLAVGAGVLGVLGRRRAGQRRT